MDNNQIKQEIIAACEKARERGRIIAHAFGSESSKHCCALTAVELVKFGAYCMKYGDNASNYFGWDEKEKWAFINGFDSEKRNNLENESESIQYPKIFQMGREIAEIVKPLG